jgi:hypothetical protein
MRLTRSEFDARVKVTSDPQPVLLSFGLCTLRASIEEAAQLASDLIEAIEQAKREGAHAD